MASKDTTIEQTSDDDADVNRLREIVAEEVSLVDRAANKRRYLIVKRSHMADDKKGTAKKPKPTEDQDAAKARGRATRAASEEEENGADGDEEKAEKARGESAADGSDDDEEDVNEAKADSAEDEDEDGEGQDEDREKEDEEKADDGEGDDEEDEDEAKRKASAGVVLPPDAKAALLDVLAQAAERLMAVANQIKDADESEDDSGISVPEDLTGELEDIGELLEEVGEQLADPTAKARGTKPAGEAKREVGKAGRRMAQSRLEQFQKALELLSSVLKELTEERKPPGQRPGAAKKPAAKGDIPGIPELVASVNDLTKIVKRQDQEITRLAKTRGTSNAIPVDGGRRRESQEEEVSWPLDMNRPISRDQVSKSTSFYDD